MGFSSVSSCSSCQWAEQCPGAAPCEDYYPADHELLRERFYFRAVASCAQVYSDGVVDYGDGNSED